MYVMQKPEFQVSLSEACVINLIKLQDQYKDGQKGGSNLLKLFIGST